jgi:HTH-type transcriptional regulator/antitoxin HigA
MATKPKQRITNAVGFASVAKSVPEAYLNLMSRFRLKLITSDQELDQAIALARELDSRADLSPVEEEYVEVLCSLIEAYEDEHYPIPDVSAGDMLRFLIDQRGVTQQTVSRETGIANSTITALLQGGRDMTRRHIETFARYFRTPPAFFLPGNSHAQPLRPAASKPRTGGRAIHVQDRTPSKKRPRQKQRKITVA